MIQSERDWGKYANWAVKILLISFLISGLIFSDLPRFEGKGWPIRVVVYPISAMIIPFLCLIRRPVRRYPHLADTFLVLPFLVDTLGNVANLFDTIEATDDVIHFLNWTFLVSAITVCLPPKYPSWNRMMIGSGFGAYSIVVWELAEWIIMQSGTTGLNLTYQDTVGDLLLSTAGGTVGAVLVVLLLNRSSSGTKS